MTILSYGEDAFTLHALKYGLDEIFAQLGDPTPSTKAIVLFRPSFGRGTRAANGRARSTFGEPDVLIGTTHATYIVEAKWDSSGERAGQDVNLRDEQTLRHPIIRAYVEAWRAAPALTWAAFVDPAASALAAVAPGFVPPSPGTRLARSLEFVLRRLEHSGPVKDVLLFCAPSKEQLGAELRCRGFDVVKYACPALDSSHFVVIDGLLESGAPTA